MKDSTKKFLVSTAVAGFMAANSFAADKPAAKAAAKTDGVKCEGANACKGAGACKTAHNECKGKNGCKGQGWSMMKTQAECDAAKKPADAKKGS